MSKKPKPKATLLQDVPCREVDEPEFLQFREKHRITLARGDRVVTLSNGTNLPLTLQDYKCLNAMLNPIKVIRNDALLIKIAKQLDAAISENAGLREDLHAAREQIEFDRMGQKNSGDKTVETKGRKPE